MGFLLCTSLHLILANCWLGNPQSWPKTEAMCRKMQYKPQQDLYSECTRYMSMSPEARITSAYPTCLEGKCCLIDPYNIWNIVIFGIIAEISVHVNVVSVKSSDVDSWLSTMSTFWSDEYIYPKSTYTRSNAGSFTHIHTHRYCLWSCLAFMTCLSASSPCLHEPTQGSAAVLGNGLDLREMRGKRDWLAV